MTPHFLHGTLRHQGNDGRANFEKEHAQWHVHGRCTSTYGWMTNYSLDIQEYLRGNYYPGVTLKYRQEVFAAFVVLDEADRQALATRRNTPLRYIPKVLVKGVFDDLLEALVCFESIGGRYSIDCATDYRPEEIVPEDYYALGIG